MRSRTPSSNFVFASRACLASQMVDAVAEVQLGAVVPLVFHTSKKDPALGFKFGFPLKCRCLWEDASSVQSRHVPRAHGGLLLARRAVDLPFFCAGWRTLSPHGGNDRIT